MFSIAFLQSFTIKITLFYSAIIMLLFDLQKDWTLSSWPQEFMLLSRT